MGPDEVGAVEMRNIGCKRAGRIAATALMLAALPALGGCSLFLPTRAEYEQGKQQVTPVLGADSLVQEGVLTVALDTNDAPDGMTDADGMVTGYYADLAAALAQRLGLSVAFVNAVGPSSVLMGDQADIFLGAVTSDEGSAVSVFGDCLEDASALYVPSVREGSISVDDLSSMTVGVQGSSAAQDSLSKAGVIGPQNAYANVNECFEALAAGEVDCVACDATAGAYLARAYEGISFAGTLDAIRAEGVAAASSKGELIEQVSSALDAMASDGTLDAIHASWFGTLPFSLSDSMLSGVTIEASGPDDATGNGGDTGIMLLDGVDINELGGA